MAGRVPPGLEVVRDRDGVEALPLGGHREVQQLPWPELLRRGLVSEVGHHVRAHILWLNRRPSSSDAIRTRCIVGVPPATSHPYESRRYRSIGYSLEYP